MAQIRWTLQAAEDLESITEYIARDSPHYASLFAIDVVVAVDRLAGFPQLGRVVPEKADPQIRELLQGNYRIIYRQIDDVVEILSVYHGSRLLDPDRLS